jgi:hypothetical protein
MNIFKKGVLATSLAASAIVASVSPAAAQDYRGDRDNTAAIAIGAGILGLAVGAIAASGNDDRYRDGRYYDRRSYDQGYYANDGWNGRNGRIYDRSRQFDRGDRRGWRNGNDRGRDWRGNDGRRGDRQRYDGRYYGRRGY